MMIRINENLSIDERELSFSYSRSPGPGGQNVNKVATKVTLRFSIADSPALGDSQKARLRASLHGRVNREGILRIISARHRTQAANRREALEKFVNLLAGALRRRRPRKATRPTRAAVERRLAEKTRRGRLKQKRRSPGTGDD